MPDAKKRLGKSPVHRARKRFGQNFLQDPHIIRRIVAAINPRQGENLIEIGPGLGALTFPLLQHCGAISAVELDRDLIDVLEEKSREFGRLRLLSQDALTTDFSEFGECQRIVGNLPYNISTPLVFHLLKYRHLIQDMHFMLQNEVVERIASHPHGKAYGRLSVMVQCYCLVEKLILVPPGAFRPPPKVESAVVRLRPKAEADIPKHDRGKLAKLVTAAFSQRRKTLRNNLRGLLTEKDMESLGVSPSLRAENISVEQFISLSELLPDKP